VQGPLAGAGRVRVVGVRVEAGHAVAEGEAESRDRDAGTEAVAVRERQRREDGFPAGGVWQSASSSAQAGLPESFEQGGLPRMPLNEFTQAAIELLAVPVAHRKVAQVG
jgi:hypothetical protein